MRLLLSLVFALAACAAPQRALASSAPAGSVLRFCLDQISEEDFDGIAGRACIGAAVRDCLENDTGAETTAGTSRCYERERAAWRELREGYVEELRAHESATQVALLDETLAAFERWAMVRCAYSASVYEGGSLSRVVAAACMNRLEGELALDLRARVQAPEAP